MLNGAAGQTDIMSVRGKRLHPTRDGEMGLAKLFASLSAWERPAALITINDLVALGTLRELQSLNLRVPEDVVLIGCGVCRTLAAHNGPI